MLAENDFNTVIEIKKIHVYCKFSFRFSKFDLNYFPFIFIFCQDIPRDGQPIILGKKANFRQNELVNLTCTAPMSNPPALLSVTLNGNNLAANSNYYQRMYQNRYDNGLTSSSVNVQFPSYWLQSKRTNMFECLSTIVHHYNRTASLKIEARSNAENKTAFYLYEQSTTHGTSYIKRESSGSFVFLNFVSFRK